jgi:hypothetical protein
VKQVIDGADIVQMLKPAGAKNFAALEQHLKRAANQGGHIWGESQLATPVLPLPTNWGWMKTNDGLYDPYWITLPELL